MVPEQRQLNCEDYPIKLTEWNTALDDKVHSLGKKENRVFSDSYRLQRAKSSFNVDAASVRNFAPNSVMEAKTSYEAKKTINAFFKTLPI